MYSTYDNLLIEFLQLLFVTQYTFSAVSGEDAQDRSDRTILTPWVKFLWESYCQCLELLRTNAHVETLYHDIAKMVKISQIRVMTLVNIIFL